MTSVFERVEFWSVSSSLVMACQRLFGTSGALFIAIKQFVLHGLPTTKTLTSEAALLLIA